MLDSAESGYGAQVDPDNQRDTEAAPESGLNPMMAGFIGSSPEMLAVYELIAKVSSQTYPVLIQGESGTGKELAARSIHLLGPRRHKALVSLNCSGLVPTLAESELFGYVQGAFTGALHTKRGLVEAADGGTLFLDEISEMSVDLQPKLLRWLQEGEIMPVGSTKQKMVDVRVVAATNRDPEAEVLSGNFRQDLFFRLNVVKIEIPPLRKRKSDILLLTRHFLKKFSPPEGPEYVMSDEALEHLVGYHWPGNVRELENAIRRAIALGSGSVLRVEDLPRMKLSAAGFLSEEEELSTLEKIEKHAIQRALQETRGNRKAAAALLGIGKSTLHRRLKQWDNHRNGS
jgi:transcriptional regulator with PAS, ATPase and Fis domain